MTSPPPAFIFDLVAVFQKHEGAISTERLDKGLTSDEVLGELRGDLTSLGFEVEKSKKREDKIQRPVFFGENGVAALQYEIDAFHQGWSCGLEVEAGRAWMGNAVSRDLIQAMLMVQVDHLVIAVPNVYKYKNGGKVVENRDFDKTAAVASALYSHDRVSLPYRLTIIGY